jgi:hypothetical protein
MGDHDSNIRWQQCDRWNTPYQIAKLRFYFFGCCRCFCCCWLFNIIFDMSSNRTCRKNVVMEELRLNKFFQSWGVVNLHRLILSMCEVLTYTSFPEVHHINTEYQFIISNCQLPNKKTFLQCFRIFFHSCTRVKSIQPLYNKGSRDSSVGIVTRYGLEGPGSNPGGARFSAPIQTGSGAHPASCTMGTGVFPGGKDGRGVMLTTHPF